MSAFDRNLREALRRREPPPGFADRVLARARPADKRPGFSFGWRWAAVVAAGVVLSSSSLLYRDHQRRLEGERAKEQVMLALRLTGSKLRGVQEHVTDLQRQTIEVREK